MSGLECHPIMHPVVISLLLLVWIYIAYMQFQRGHVVLAAVFLVAGVLLTLSRLKRRR